MEATDLHHALVFFHATHKGTADATANNSARLPKALNSQAVTLTDESLEKVSRSVGGVGDIPARASGTFAWRQPVMRSLNHAISNAGTEYSASVRNAREDDLMDWRGGSRGSRVA